MVDLDYQFSEDADGNISITTSKDGETEEFIQFEDEISIGCLLMENQKNYEYEDERWQNHDEIFCRGVLPFRCLEVSTIQDILEYGYAGENLTLAELVKFYLEKKETVSAESIAETYHKTIDNNENIAVYLEPSEDNDTTRAFLSYYPWAIYALQGKSDFIRHISLHVSLPLKIYNEIRNSVLSKKPIDHFIITIKPKMLKLSSQTPEETASFNSLFCQKSENFYALLFHEEVGSQNCTVKSINYKTDPLEIKNKNSINQYGSWKNESGEVPPIQQINYEIIELRETLQNEIIAQNKILKGISEKLALNKKWWRRL